MTAKRYATKGAPADDGRVMGIAPPSTEEQLLAACCVIRHSRTTEGAWELFAMLGLDDRDRGYDPRATCGDCGYRKSSQNHKTLCGSAA
jgi:hypothetical protein